MSPSSRLHLQMTMGVGLITAALMLFWLANPGESRTHGTLLSDSTGRLSLVATSLNSARQSPLRNAQLVTNIVNALPSNVKVLLLGNDLEAFTLAHNPDPERVRFVEVDAESLTIWPQDPFLVLRDERGAPVLLTPRRFERAGDRAMADAIAALLEWRVEVSELFFEGGNVVSDDTHAFVGANTIRRNALEFGESEQEIAERFERELGRSVVVIGPVPQPVGHIDLVLTPLGGGRLALADPTSGSQLVSRLLETSPEVVRAFERDAEERFFGHPSIRELPLRKGGVLRAPALTDATERSLRRTRELAPIFEEVRLQLEARGFEVIRIPILLAPPSDDESAQQPGYPLLSYNNVLVERGEGRDRVYLPEYGLAPLDAAARDAWAAAGFEVLPVRGLTPSAAYGGALRCAVKVLDRN